MTTYDPANPDPIHRTPRSRSERVAAWLCALLICLAVVPWVVPLSGWALALLAFVAVVLAVTVALLLVVPRLMGQADAAEIESEDPPTPGAEPTR